MTGAWTIRNVGPETIRKARVASAFRRQTLAQYLEKLIASDYWMIELTVTEDQAKGRAGR